MGPEPTITKIKT